MTDPHISQAYISPYSQHVLKDEQHSPIKDFLSKRKQQLINQKQIQSRLETAVKQKTEMILYAGQPKSLDDINVTMGLDIVTTRNYELTSMKGLGSRPELKSLNLHHNYLVSFKYLDEQPQMEEFHAPMNTICSFYGFSEQPRLKDVNLNGNPIVKHGLYRIMLLIVGSLNIKMIGKKPVLFREKQAAELYLTLFPLAREAIRAGWLIDLDKHPLAADEEGAASAPTFESIAHTFHSTNMDDATVIKQTEQFQKLLSGEFAKYKLEYFEKWLHRRFESQQRRKSKKGTKSKGKSSLAAKEQKIKLLKKRIDKLKLDLKQQRSFSQQQMQLQSEMREKIKEELRAEMSGGTVAESNNGVPRIEIETVNGSLHKSQVNQDTILTIDDIVYFDVLQCHSFAYVINPKGGNEKRCNKVKLQLSADSCIIVTNNDILENEILYSEIQKNTFYLGDSGLSRLHISLTNGDAVDLFSRNLELAKSAFKALHMFIEAHKHSITRVSTPSATPVSGKRVNSALKQAWSDENDDVDFAASNAQHGGAASEEKNGGAVDEAQGATTAAAGVEFAYYFHTPDSSNRQLNFDDMELEEGEEVGQHQPVELASSSYDNVDESVIEEVAEEEDADEQQSEEAVAEEPEEPVVVEEVEMPVAEQPEEPAAEENQEQQPETDDAQLTSAQNESDVMVGAPSEEAPLVDDAAALEEPIEETTAAENDKISAPHVDTALYSEQEENTASANATEDAPQLEDDDDLEAQAATESEQLTRYEEEDRRLQDNVDVLGAEHDDESLTAPQDAPVAETAIPIDESKVIQSPVLYKENEKAPKMEARIQLKPVDEESEEERLAREQKEREMKELFEAFQRRVQEYGREAASDWLKEELAKLSPPERIRKELEVLERFHLVSEAKKLFEKGGR